MYFDWIRGRTLASIQKDNGNTCINFVVNHDGIRINKNVMRIESGITDYNFEYNGNLLVRQSWNNNVMWFLYDESGNPVGFTLNDTEYYYIKNLQGDITAITDANGIIVAKYTYDEWGKILSITDANGNDVSANANHIANINPLRYRGYYYDSETGFYYLLTRYYDPVTRRFINADGQLNTDSLLGFNMFAYCENNPVMYVDPTGEWPWFLPLIRPLSISFRRFLTGLITYIEADKKTKEEEILALAQTIYGEAGGYYVYPDEWQKGQEAVAWTIINRYNSDKYPSDWLKIVKADQQFTGYKRGKTLYENGDLHKISWDYSYYLATNMVYKRYEKIPYPEGFTPHHTNFRQDKGQSYSVWAGIIRVGGNVFFCYKEDLQ